MGPGKWDYGMARAGFKFVFFPAVIPVLTNSCSGWSCSLALWRCLGVLAGGNTGIVNRILRHHRK